MNTGTNQRTTARPSGGVAFETRPFDTAGIEEWLGAIQSRNRRLVDPEYRPGAPGVRKAHIAKGLDVPLGVLFEICEALHANNIHVINVDDLKWIVSKHGADLRGLDTLAEPMRRRAESALYTVIADRCTTLANVDLRSTPPAEARVKVAEQKAPRTRRPRG